MKERVENANASDPPMKPRHCLSIKVEQIGWEAEVDSEAQGDDVDDGQRSGSSLCCHPRFCFIRQNNHVRCEQDGYDRDLVKVRYIEMSKYSRQVDV